METWQKLPYHRNKHRSNQKCSRNRRKNSTKEQRTALKDLAAWNYIIITKADKGRTVVIIEFNDYVKEAEHQLNNKDA